MLEIIGSLEVLAALPLSMVIGAALVEQGYPGPLSIDAILRI